MTFSLIAAMAMSMAPPPAAEAENCASHYMAVGTIVGVALMKENATEEEENAAVTRALPWFVRASDALKASGVAVPDGEAIPENVKERSRSILNTLIDGTFNAEQVIGTVKSCDQAYGFETIMIDAPSE